MKLKFKPGVAERLVWSAPDSRITPFCSLCQRYIADDAVPIMMWNGQGACVQFCDSCAAENITVAK